MDVVINLDDGLENADWVKTAWDLPTTVDGMVALLGDDWLQQVEHLPVWDAAPAELRAAVAKSVLVAVPVTKHLPGKHNQKDHAGKGGGRGDDGLAPEGLEKEFAAVLGSKTPFLDSQLRGHPLGMLAAQQFGTMAPEVQALADGLLAKGKADGLSDEEAQHYMLAQLARTGDVLHHRKELAGMSPDAVERLASNIDLVRREGDVCIAIDEGSLRAMLREDEPQFRTQHETGSSNGAFAPTARRVAESRTLDVPLNAAPSERPIYGFVAHEPSWEDALSMGAGRDTAVGSEAVDQYGNIRVVLKPSVKSRTSMTAGDSLNTGALPVPMTGEVSRDRLLYATTERKVSPDMTTSKFSLSEPGGASGMEAIADFSVSQDGYFEAQIRGGVKLSDIARVEVHDWYSDTVVEALRARGIQVDEY